MIEDLRAFVTVVDKRSLTKAAEALSITQSAVSRRLQQLEEILGAKLLDRSSKPLSITAIGRRVHDAALPLLRDMAELIAIPKENEEPTGGFRLGLSHVVADAVLYDVIAQTRSDYPAVALRSQTDWSTALQTELSHGHLDSAVLLLAENDKSYQGRGGTFIAELDIAIVQSLQSPIVAAQARLPDLAEHEWILNPDGCGYRAALQRSMDTAGKPVRIAVDTYGTETQLRLVAAGLGLGLVPRALLATSSFRHQLVEIQVDDFSLKLALWMVEAIDIGSFRRVIDMLVRILSQAFAAH